MHQVPGAQVENLGGYRGSGKQFRNPIVLPSGEGPAMGVANVPAVEGSHLGVRCRPDLISGIAASSRFLFRSSAF